LGDYKSAGILAKISDSSYGEFGSGNHVTPAIGKSHIFPMLSIPIGSKISSITIKAGTTAPTGNLRFGIYQSFVGLSRAPRTLKAESASLAMAASAEFTLTFTEFEVLDLLWLAIQRDVADGNILYAGNVPAAMPNFNFFHIQTYGAFTADLVDVINGIGDTNMFANYKINSPKKVVALWKD